MSDPVFLTAEESNKRLSRINFVTSIEDFLTLLASLKLLHMLTGSALVAGYVIPIRSLGLAIGSMIFPRLISNRGIQKVLAYSELISGIFSVIVIASIFLGAPAWWFLLLFGLQAISKQQFTLGRDTYSKLLGTAESHRSLTAQIVGGLYGAAFIGSILGYGVLQFAHPGWLFGVDALTFLISSSLCFRMDPKVLSTMRLSILKPLKYLKGNMPLLSIFLIRGVAVWIPIGVFNYLLYTLTEERFHIDISANGWTYVATAAGSVLSSMILGPRLRMFAKHHDAMLAAGGSLLIGLTRFGLLQVPSFAALIAVIFVAGIFNGSNMIASQTLLRRIASESEFPEVSALEQILGKLSDFLAATGSAFLVGGGYMTYSTGIVVSAVSFGLVAVLYVVAPLRREVH
ncbi:MAG: hypothetical protein A2Z97_04475 [Bdellovibrionales bacterium GWB1_52_6]|nr:MAG: hypothetical protein A2Z97_04475 [Bdellovibrionales bacterium GWB1_52_6]OFZ02732.1 MAG: hypothetical protein A2X97_12380 [Bdellovibrionales bacterium GWA1_52_35]HCM41632.1 hypothetical protein [Bdellovibrionales bacterium]